MLLLACFQLRCFRLERGLTSGKPLLGLGERSFASLELLRDRRIWRRLDRSGRWTFAGRERRLAGGQLLLPRVELGAALVEGRAALLGLGETEADRVEPRAAPIGRLELLLALLDPGERVGELPLALLHLGDAFRECPLEHGQLVRRLDPLSAQGLSLRLDVGGLVFDRALSAPFRGRWYFS